MAMRSSSSSATFANVRRVDPKLEQKGSRRVDSFFRCVEPRAKGDDCRFCSQGDNFSLIEVVR